MALKQVESTTILGCIPCVAQIVLRRDKVDKGDKEDKGDKGGSTEKEQYICKNGMLPNSVALAIAAIFIFFKNNVYLVQHIQLSFFLS